MARTFIWIGAASLVVAVSLAGSYLYYQHSASTVVAQLSRHLPASVQFVYDAVSVDLNGEIHIENATFTPTDGMGGVSVERITLITPGAAYLLGEQKQLQSGQLPAIGEAQLKGIHLPLTPVTIPLVDSYVADPLAEQEVFGELLMACGGHAPLSLQQLYEMGITELNSDLSVSYQYDHSGKLFRTQWNYTLDQLFELQGAALIVSDAPVTSPYMFEHYANWFREANFSYQDRGYHQQRNQYCASLDDDILDQYLKLHREQLTADLRATGWQISPTMAYAYQRVMSERGDFQVRLKPKRDIMLSELRALSLVDDWHKLAPELRIGKEWTMLGDLYQPVDNATLVASIQHQTRVAAPGAGMDKDTQRQKTLEAIRRAVQGGQNGMPEKTYRAMEVGRINEFIGHWVKLETYFGRKVHGTLERIEGKMLYVDQHMQQGSAVYPIDKTKLARLQVLH